MVKSADEIRVKADQDIEIEAQKLTLRFHDTHHTIAIAAHPQSLTEGVAISE